MGKIYKGDVGKTFIIDTGLSLSTATKKELHVTDESGNTNTWTADIYGTTQLQYTTTTPDLDVVGIHKVQAYIEFSEFSKHLGEVFSFRVHDLFKEK